MPKIDRRPEYVSDNSSVLNTPSEFLRKLAETLTATDFTTVLSELAEKEQVPSTLTQAERISQWLNSNRGILKSEDVLPLLRIERRLILFSNQSLTHPSIRSIAKTCLSLLHFPERTTTRLLTSSCEMSSDNVSKVVKNIALLFKEIKYEHHRYNIIEAYKAFPENQRDYNLFCKLELLFDKKPKGWGEDPRHYIIEAFKTFPENQRDYALLCRLKSLVDEKLSTKKGWDQRQQIVEVIKAFLEDKKEHKIITVIKLFFEDVIDENQINHVIWAINALSQDQRNFKNICELVDLFKEIPNAEEREDLLSAIQCIPEERNYEIIKKLQVLWKVIVSEQKVHRAIDWLLFYLPSKNRVDFINTLYQSTEEILRTPSLLLEKAHEHVLRQLENLLNVGELDAVKRLAEKICNHQSKLLLYQEHPLTQAAIRVLTLTVDTENRKNPFTVYKILQDETRLTPTISLPKEIIDEVSITLNPETFTQNAVVRTVTFDQLPKGISAQFLHVQFESMKTRLKQLGTTQKNEILKEIQASTGTTFNALYKNIVLDPFIQTFAVIKGKPEESVPVDFARYLALANYLNDQSNEIQGNMLLSPREELLLAMSNSIQACSGGKKEGIALYYNLLPEAYKYHTDVKVEAPDIEQTLKYIQGGIQETLHSLLSSDNSMLKELTGTSETIEQLAHVSIFIKNRIGSRVGFSHTLTFDQHTQVLFDHLFELTLEDTLNIFYKYVTPTRLIQELQNWFVREKENVQNLITQFNALIESRLGKLDYDTIWEHDEEYTKASFTLTKEGARKILLAAGYLK